MMRPWMMMKEMDNHLDFEHGWSLSHLPLQFLMLKVWTWI
jgi:hypothetical protein